MRTVGNFIDHKQPNHRETNDERIDRRLNERLQECKTPEEIARANKEAELEKKLVRCRGEFELEKVEAELRALRGVPEPPREIKI